ncbi:MAG: type II toxin-antitoxin system VapC family toxin [Acidimicrobiaceae bacterium]|nr:type II toxin-antitoxin system VapC family toxin [Acidimicrobiaceae bacterium]
MNTGRTDPPVAVVIDASAGVELVADTSRGRMLRRLLPPNPVPWVPDLFYGECGGVLRKWDLNGIVSPERMGKAIADLTAWPLRMVQTAGLWTDAWRLRRNFTFADAVYVALAAHLGADILTDDAKLANAPTLPVRALHL